MRDFLVISDGTSEDELLFVCAEALASSFNGYINVVVTTELQPLSIGAAEAGVYVPPDSRLQDEALARGAKIKSAAERRFQQHSSPVTVFRVNGVLEELGRAVAEIARTHDLCVTTLPTGDADSERRKSILDRVLIEGGRGLLGLPPGTTCNEAFDRVAIAWNGSKECSRAISQAMPFIRKAREVTVILVDPKLRRAGDEFRPGDDNIINHFNRHGISATLSRVASGGLHTSAAILAEATRTGSGLLVMGAQAEGGLLHWFQSRTSSEVFAASPIPLMMAH